MSQVADVFARGPVAGWLGSLASGAALGGAVAAALHLEIGPELAGAALRGVQVLNRTVSPVWVPMALVGMRVGWLAVQAQRTRRGHGALGTPVRPELLQLAPLFAALGLAGTVWGLGTAFDALDRGDFLSRLPALLGGLGAAMTSTLVGLGLQIGTLLLAAFNPSWSRAHVRPKGEGLAFYLDRVSVGDGLVGLGRLLGALAARQPEALHVVFDARIPRPDRERLIALLWERSDSAIQLRESSL